MENWLVNSIFTQHKLINLHGSITSWFVGVTTEISMLWILRYLHFIALVNRRRIASKHASSWGCPHVAYEDITNIAVY